MGSHRRGPWRPTEGQGLVEPASHGRSDGGIWVYIPPKSVQVDFLWGKNDVKTAIEHEY